MSDHGSSLTDSETRYEWIEISVKKTHLDDGLSLGIDPDVEPEPCGSGDESCLIDR